MKCKATKKFQELSINPNHHNLDRADFLALMAGKIVDCKPPKQLLDDGYLVQVKKASK